MSQLSVLHSKCPHCEEKQFSKKGFFYKKSTKTYIPRYVCLTCKKTFSTRTGSITFNQKRTDLNPQIFNFHCSGVSLRQTARILKCSYRTVYLKFLWLGIYAKSFHFNQSFVADQIQFDEMESIEHTKLKPLTIALAVNEKYQILGASVGQIPAKGYLADISVKKYGRRCNESYSKIKELLLNIKTQIKNPIKEISSDAKSSYKGLVKEIFPKVYYKQHIAQANKEKNREQKYLSTEKRKYDPLFKVNHMCARFRDHIKRLTRRSWCTTKKKEHLELAVYLYIAHTNKYKFL